MIARFLGRQHEFAVRPALGAGQLRLMRQLLSEGALLSLAGCVVGFGLASLTLGPHAATARHHSPIREYRRTLDRHRRPCPHRHAHHHTLPSLIPASLAARTDPQPALQTASRGLGSCSVRVRLSGWVVAGEVALSVVLLISTGLLFRTLWNLEHARNVRRRQVADEDVDRYAEMFSALGTALRLRIMRLLLSAHPNGMIMGDIQAETSIPSSTLSHHLDKLRHQDLVAVRREGTFLGYSVRTDSVRELVSFLYAECCTRNRLIEPGTVVSIAK